MNAIHRLFLATLLVSGLSLQGDARANEPWFSQAELDQMLAPVALYPDTVLSHVLIAATYPLEVIQAARWSRANPGLSGEAAVAAVEHMDWDPSVMALVAFPELLARMDEDIEWTHRMGDAFLVQEADVIDTIQGLRERAYAAGNLRSNEQVKVVRETRYIYIEPARPRVVYVPYYDPFVVYGSWWWHSHPPVVWRHRPRLVASVSFHWGPAYHVAPAFYFSSFHWSRRQVVVVHHHHHHHHHRHFRSGREVARYTDARHWQHNPQHRRGVSYHRGVSEKRFVQTQATSSRAASVRSAQPRNTQRDWAAERRSSLNLNERQAARTTQPAASSTRNRAAQIPRARAESGGTDRLQQAPRQRASAQTEFGQTHGTSREQSVRSGTNPRESRQVAPERSARQLQDSLAAGRAAPQRQERQAASPASRSQSSHAGERSAAARGQSNPAANRPAVERATSGAPARQAPSVQARSAQRSGNAVAERPNIQRSEPNITRRSAPAAQRSQPSISQRPATAPRNQASVPSRPVAAPQSRSQSTAAPTRRSAPAASAPAQRPAPAPQSASRNVPAQRQAPSQRDNSAPRVRSRER